MSQRIGLFHLFLIPTSPLFLSPPISLHPSPPPIVEWLVQGQYLQLLGRFLQIWLFQLNRSVSINVHAYIHNGAPTIHIHPQWCTHNPHTSTMVHPQSTYIHNGAPTIHIHPQWCTHNPQLSSALGDFGASCEALLLTHRKDIISMCCHPPSPPP